MNSTDLWSSPLAMTVLGLALVGLVLGVIGMKRFLRNRPQRSPIYFWLSVVGVVAQLVVFGPTIVEHWRAAETLAAKLLEIRWIPILIFAWATVLNYRLHMRGPSRSVA